jgi:mycothiol synthase
MSYHPIPYQAGDLQRLTDLIYRIRPREFLSAYPTRVDFEELLEDAAVRDATCLWFDQAGELVGYSLVYPLFCNLHYEADPGRDMRTLQAGMIRWGLERFRELKKAGTIEAGAALDTAIDEQDTLGLDLLKAQGFIPQDLQTLHLARNLSEPIPPVILPAGFSIRPLSGESEAEAVVSLYRAAYGSQRMSLDEVLAIMRTSSYDRELDLVAVAEDGNLAGLCTCTIETELNDLLPEKQGATDPVLVHPRYQGLGLARALIWSGWERLKQRGIAVAVLSTSSENSKGIAAFTKAGYAVVRRSMWLSHPVI